MERRRRRPRTCSRAEADQPTRSQSRGDDVASDRGTGPGSCDEERPADGDHEHGAEQPPATRERQAFGVAVPVRASPASLPCAGSASDRLGPSRVARRRPSGRVHRSSHRSTSGQVTREHGRGPDPAARPDVPLPSYAHPGDAGADIVTTVDVDAGPGRAGDGPDRDQHRAAGRLRRPRPPALRSGGQVRGLDRQRPGTIDAGYRGEVKVLLVNLDPHEPVRSRAATGSPSSSSSGSSRRASSRSTGFRVPTGRRRVRFDRRVRDRRSGATQEEQS